LVNYSGKFNQVSEAEYVLLISHFNEVTMKFLYVEGFGKILDDEI